MKRTIRLLGIAVFLLLSPPGRTEDLAERAARSAWLKAHQSYQAATRSEKDKRPADARQQYMDALTRFDAVRREYPDWNAATVKMRMTNCRTAVGRLDKQLSKVAAAKTTELNELKEQLRQVNLALAAARKQADLCAPALKQLETITIQLNRLEKDNLSLRKQLKACTSASGDTARKDLSAALGALDGERVARARTEATLKGQIKKQGTSLKELRDRLRTLSLKELDTRSKLLKANRVFADLEAKLKDAKAEADATKKDLTKTKLLLAEHQTNARSLLATNNELKTAIKALKDKNKDGLRNKVVEQELTVGVLRGKLQQETKVQRGLKSKIKSLTEDLDVLQTANGELRTELKDFKTHGLEELCGELKATIEHLQAKNVDLSEQNERLKKSHSDQLEISRTLRKKVAEASNGVKTPGEVKKLRSDLAAADKRSKLFQQQAQASDQRLKSVESQATLDRELLKATMHKQKELEQDLAECRTRLEVKADDDRLNEKLRGMLVNATRLDQDGKIAKAVATCEQVLALDEENFAALMLLGTMHFKQGSLREAAQPAGRAASLKPSSFEANLLLARILLGQSKGRIALMRALRAQELRPKDKDVPQLVGQSLSMVGWHQAAEAELLKIWQTDKTNASTALSLVEAYLNWQPPRRKAANEWYSRARKLGAPADAKLEKRLTQNPE